MAEVVVLVLVEATMNVGEEHGGDGAAELGAGDDAVLRIAYVAVAAGMAADVVVAVERVAGEDCKDDPLSWTMREY